MSYNRKLLKQMTEESKRDNSLPKYKVEGWLDNYGKKPIVNKNGYLDGEPPAGSNWRIPGNKITMDLPGMPNEILAVSDKGEKKRVKKGQEATFNNAEYVDEYSLEKAQGGGILDNIQIGLDAAQFVPALGQVAYIASLPFTAYDVGKELLKGDYKQAGVDALGFIPGLKAFKYGLKGNKILDTTSKLAKQYKKINNTISTTNLTNDIKKKRDGGDISIPDLEEGNWLNRYDDGGSLPKFQMRGEVPAYARGPMIGDIQMRGNQNLLTEIPYRKSKEKKAEEKVQKLIQYKNYNEKAARHAVQNKTKPGERDLKEIERVETRAAAHPDYKPESSYQQMQALSDAGDLRSRILRGANLLTNQGTPLDFVTGLVTDPGKSFANLTLDAKNQYLNPENSALENATNLGFDLLTVAPTAVSKVASKAPQAVKQAGEYLTTQTPLRNAYKINPWAFKVNEANWYRQVGKSAIDDALSTGVIREAGEEVSPRMWEEFQDQIKRLRGEGIEDSFEKMKQSVLAGRRPASPFFAKGELFYPMGRKPTITKSGKVSKNPAGKGSADYLIETALPNESFQPAYVKGMSLGVPEEIGSTAILKPNPDLRSLENFKLYKQDWLRGYKEVPKPKSTFKSEIDWAKWNPETPTHKVLMDEYNAIEESTKKAGTWMKNADGSPFQGTPEQFIQQQSSWFKKAFPNVLRDEAGNVQINYHGSPENISEFLPNSNMGELGTGIYTTTNKGYAKGFANSRKGTNPTILELYQNTNNPQPFYKEYKEFANDKIKQFNKKTRFLPKFTDKYKFLSNELDKDLSGRHSDLYTAGKFYLQEPFDLFTKGHQTIVPFTNYPKSAIGNVGFFDMTNPNIYKAIVPVATGTTALGAIEQKKKGGQINWLNKYK